MIVGVLRLVLQIPEANSLKARRSVVRSFKERVRARLPVTIAEIGDAERYQVASFGVAVVSSDARRCQEVLGRVASMARTLPDAVLADVAVELVHFGVGGSSLQGRLGDDWEAGSEASEEEPLPWDPKAGRPSKGGGT
ncbi:MAG: DUF503 domain-containing protein [Polyangiaceae bacterium]|nr:DUF503 domain-containing protein [Polyangiaceae bacterium]